MERRPSRIAPFSVVAAALVIAGCAVLATVLDLQHIPLPPDGASGFESLVVTDFSQAIRPTAAAAGSFRPGSNADIAVAMWGKLGGERGTVEEGSLAVLLAHAGPPLRFTLGQELPSGRSPAAIATGDFNGDGIPDVAVVNWNGLTGTPDVLLGTLAVFLGAGDGTFRQVWTLESRFPSPTGIAVADFDRNGYDDIVIGTNSDRGTGVSVFFFDAQGPAPPIQLPTGGVAGRSITVGDFNNDSQPDFAVANLGKRDDPGTVGVTVFLSAPERRFDRRFVPLVGVRPVALTAGRFTRKSLTDLVVLAEHELVILAGHGNGDFTELRRVEGITAGGFQSQGIRTADFDRDGNDDVAFVESDFVRPAAAVVVLLGDGNGGFKRRLEVSRRDTSPNAEMARGAILNNLAVADVNHDGYPDIIVPGISLEFVQQFRQDREEAHRRADARGFVLVYLNRLMRRPADTALR